MKTRFEQPGTYRRLGPIGRAGRGFLGAVVLYLAIDLFLLRWRGWLATREGWELPGGLWYVPVLLVVYFLPSVLDRLLTLNWGWRWQAAWGGVVVLLAVLDLAYYGSLWAAPLGTFLLGTIVLLLSLAGVAHLVQGIAATPG